MGKTQIGVSQLAQMLFISNIFFLMMFNASTAPEIDGSIFMAGHILAIPFMFLCLLPLYWLNKGGIKRDIVTTALQVNKVWGKLLGVIYMSYMVMMAVNTSAHFEFFLSSAIYPESEGTPFILIMLAICGYACFLGIEPLARMSGIVLVVLLVCSGVILIPLIKDVRLYNLHWINSVGIKQVAISTFGSVVSLSDFAVLLLISDGTSGSLKKVLPKLVLGTVLFYEIIAFFTTTVAGDYAQSMMFPLYSLSSIAEFSVLERLDSIYMMIWLLIGFVRISLFLYTGSLVLTKITSLSLNKALSIHIVVTAFLGVLNSTSLEALVNTSRFMKTGILFLLLMVALPCITLIILKIQEGRKRKCEKLV